MVPTPPPAVERPVVVPVTSLPVVAKPTMPPAEAPKVTEPAPRKPANTPVLPLLNRLTGTTPVLPSLPRKDEPAAPKSAMPSFVVPTPLASKSSTPVVQAQATSPAPAAPSKPVLPVVEKAAAALSSGSRSRSVTPVTPAPVSKPPLSHAEARELTATQETPAAPQPKAAPTLPVVTQTVAPQPKAVSTPPAVMQAAAPQPKVVPTAPAPVMTPAAPPGVAVPGMEATPLTAGGGNDWRQSWSKPAVVTKTGSRVEETTSGRVVIPPTSGEVRHDPLQSPELYSRPALTQVPQEVRRPNPAMPVVVEERVMPSQPTSTGPTVVDSKRRMTFMHHLRGTAVPLTEAEVRALEQGQPQDGQPLGVRSITAAGGAPTVLPVPVVTIPPLRQQPQPQVVPVPQQPTEDMVNAFTPPGTMPPAPMMPRANTVAPRQVMPPVSPVGYSRASDRLTVGGQQGVAEMVQTLQHADLPSQREYAAEGLAKVDVRANPAVAMALAAAAQSDPASMVRTCCIRSLAKMKANAPEVMQVLHKLRGDADPRVREAAQEALVVLIAAGAQRSQ
jgi:hypothetical protein